jgi:ParB-like chromosome segregation protein Spo0J
LEHIGLIEPLAVFPQSEERFLVTNGNLRLHILRELKVAKVRCTVALDDESYTYNKRVNSLSPIALNIS